MPEGDNPDGTLRADLKVGEEDVETLIKESKREMTICDVRGKEDVGQVQQEVSSLGSSMPDIMDEFKLWKNRYLSLNGE